MFAFSAVGEPSTSWPTIVGALMVSGTLIVELVIWLAPDRGALFAVLCGRCSARQEGGSGGYQIGAGVICLLLDSSPGCRVVRSQAVGHHRVAVRSDGFCHDCAFVPVRGCFVGMKGHGLIVEAVPG